MILEQLEKLSNHSISKKSRKEMTKEEFEKMIESILSNSETYEKVPLERGYLGIGLRVKKGTLLTWWEERKNKEED